MKRTFTILALFTMLWTTLAAQTSLLPTLQQVRQEYPAGWSHAQRGEFLNKVAYIHRADGWGLLRKPGGNRCPTPQGVDVSCDYLVFGPTMQGFDVLVNDATPTWQTGDNFASSPERFLLPVAPNVGTPDPIPGPVEPPPVTGPSLEQQILDELRAHEAAEKVRWETAAFEWDKVKNFLYKFVIPAVTAFLGGRALAQ